MLKYILAFLFLAGFAHATLLSACGPIILSGTYTMTGGVTIGAGGTCYTVAASDVTIDCQSNSVDAGLFTTSRGVFSDQSGTVIKNCKFTGFAQDIVLNNIRGASVSNIVGGSDYGLVLSNVNDST